MTSDQQLFLGWSLHCTRWG